MKGFTLIEILLVIAAIAIILMVGIGANRLMSIRDSQTVEKCQ